MNEQYCVYLTTYLGNAFPPKSKKFKNAPQYYIGSAPIDAINRGYRGSVCSKVFAFRWGQELKQHPELFTIEILSRHQEKQEARFAERNIQVELNVIKDEQYFNKGITGPLLSWKNREIKLTH